LNVGGTLPGSPYAGPLNGASRWLTRRDTLRAGFAALTPSGKENSLTRDFDWAPEIRRGLRPEQVRPPE